MLNDEANVNFHKFYDEMNAFKISFPSRATRFVFSTRVRARVMFDVIAREVPERCVV